MSLLIVLICLQSPCDELNAHAVWRAEMTTGECDAKLPALVEYVQEYRLNPPKGYYKLHCRSQLPKV